MSNHLTHPKYRPDIDGLRAVAVLLVVAFHAFPKVANGGFIGVDIFFVISGFLISTIIVDTVERNNFSFVDFYKRRVTRIFPATFLVLVACLSFGWMVLLPDEYRQLGKHAAGGAGFMSNFILLNEKGYFDNSAETKPLLHLWSLGVEEQFYILWPLILVFAWKKRLNLLTIAVFVAVGSFVWNLDLTRKDFIAAFFSPQARFWELMAGSMLAYRTLHASDRFSSFRKKLDASLGQIIYAIAFAPAPAPNGDTLRNVQSIVGAALISVGACTITKDSLFPGWWALLPIIGAVLIISAGPGAWLNRVVLSSSILVWLGLVSFPLYLWHWPMLSFARIVEAETPSPIVRGVAVLASLFFAWLTFRFVERPIRHSSDKKAIGIALLVSMTAVGAFGLSAYISRGYTNRQIAKLNLTVSSGQAGWTLGNGEEGCGVRTEEDRKTLEFCMHDRRGPATFALVGDSHAGSLSGGLIRTSAENGRWVFLTGNADLGAPIMLLSDRGIYRRYAGPSLVALDAISHDQNIKVVVIADAARTLFQLTTDRNVDELPSNPNYDVALSGLTDGLQKLLAAGKKIVMVVDNPTLPDPKDCLHRVTGSELLNRLLRPQPAIDESCRVALSRHLELTLKYRRLLNDVRSLDASSISIFDPTKIMCDEQHDVCSLVKDGHLMYSFGDHISDYAAGLIGTDLNRFLQLDMFVSAFSSEMDTSSREDNASKQRTRASIRFNRIGKGSAVVARP